VLEDKVVVEEAVDLGAMVGGRDEEGGLWPDLVRVASHGADKGSPTLLATEKG